METEALLSLVRPRIFLALSMLLMIPTFTASLDIEKTGGDEKNKVTSLHLEIVTPHEDAELKDFTNVLWAIGSQSCPKSPIGSRRDSRRSIPD
jgi:hypothetical protein